MEYNIILRSDNRLDGEQLSNFHLQLHNLKINKDREYIITFDAVLFNIVLPDADTNIYYIIEINGIGSYLCYDSINAGEQNTIKIIVGNSMNLNTYIEYYKREFRIKSLDLSQINIKIYDSDNNLITSNDGKLIVSFKVKQI